MSTSPVVKKIMTSASLMPLGIPFGRGRTTTPVTAFAAPCGNLRRLRAIEARRHASSSVHTMRRQMGTIGANQLTRRLFSIPPRAASRALHEGLVGSSSVDPLDWLIAERFGVSRDRCSTWCVLRSRMENVQKTWALRAQESARQTTVAARFVRTSETSWKIRRRRAHVMAAIRFTHTHSNSHSLRFSATKRPNLDVLQIISSDAMISYLKVFSAIKYQYT